jgi:hypothetical protein
LNKLIFLRKDVSLWTSNRGFPPEPTAVDRCPKDPKRKSATPLMGDRERIGAVAITRLLSEILLSARPAHCYLQRLPDVFAAIDSGIVTDIDRPAIQTLHED